VPHFDAGWTPRTPMPYFDMIVFAVIALSTLFAYVRGVVRELVAIASWIVGLVAALHYSNPAAALFSGFDISPAARHVLAFVLILFVVLLAGALVAQLLKGVVHGVGLGFVDRFLGAVFGVLRGALLVIIFALIAGLTGLPRHDWWQNSIAGPILAESALALRPYMPPEWEARLDFSASGKARAAGAQKASRAPDREAETCAES
jgi:membrane protein required for colicin V production